MHVVFLDRNGIKIICDESLGNNSFDSGGLNSLATASINSELNGSYFDSMAESNKAIIGNASCCNNDWLFNGEIWQ